MRVINDLYWAPDFGKGSIVTIGEFDGFHLDQRAIIEKMIDAGKKADLPTIVVTFDTNLPRGANGGEDTTRFLTTVAQKLTQFAAAGVDNVVLLPVDEVTTRGGLDAGATPAESGLMDWLINNVALEALHARALVVGETVDDAVWGSTDLRQLIDRGAAAGFDVIEVAATNPAENQGIVLSSGAIRHALDTGDVGSASAMLGRPYEVRSVVARGEQRGRHIGFPTANLPVPADIQIPGDGVYACWYYREDGTRFKAAVNVGKRPTFYPDNDQSLIEAHLLDYRGDLYAEPARLAFIDRIRAEQKFDNITELADQLKADIVTAAARLAT